MPDARSNGPSSDYGGGMTDGLPDEAVRRTRRCPKCGELTDRLSHCFVKGSPMFPQTDSDTATEPVDVLVPSALPPGTVIVVGEDGQVTCRTKREAEQVIENWLDYELTEYPYVVSVEAIAALSATDPEETTGE